MGTTTKIPYVHHTFNAWRGCFGRGDPGCKNCYARRQAKRNPKLLGEWEPDGLRVAASEGMWNTPAKWDAAAALAGERRRVLCGSMCDVLEARPDLDVHRVRLGRTIAATRSLDWLVLTKRPENYATLGRHWLRPWAAGESLEMLRAPPWAAGESLKMFRAPLPNLWAGVTITHQADIERLDPLRDFPAALRWASFEPLIGPVELGRRVEWLDWAVIGGESGPKARPCNLAHVYALADELAAAAVPVYVKQLGARPYDPEWHGDGTPEGSRMIPNDPKGADPDEWPRQLQRREFPTGPFCDGCGELGCPGPCLGIDVDPDFDAGDPKELDR